MRSKIAISILAILLSSCGLLGKKDAPASDGTIGNTGCLNNTGDLVTKYVTGNVSQGEWKGAFDCVNQSLDFFTNYVHGDTQDSYSPNDMYTLVSKFLITNHPVHEALVNGAFNLKAALFGGSVTEFKKDEIDLVKTSLTRLRDITADLIPYLAIRQQANPSYEQMNEMIDAFNRAGDQLADLVGTLPTAILTSDAMNTLINELTVSMDLPTIQNLSDILFISKWMLFNTRKDAVEVTDWPNVMRTSMGIAGIYLAFQASLGTDLNSPQHQLLQRLQNDYVYREFVYGLIVDLKPYLNNMLTHHGGVVPFPLFDDLIEDLPASLLNGVSPKTLEQALRPMAQKLMASTTGEGLDQSVLDNLYDLLDNFAKDLGLLDRFYEQTGLNHDSVQPKDFSNALNRYSVNLDGASGARFAIMKQKMLTYQPLFDGNTGRIRYETGLGYSKVQQLAVLGVDRLARLIIKAYGSGPDYVVDADMTAFFNEYKDLFFQLRIIDPTITDFGPKRRQDMDLFNNASDGNGQGSITEIVNYAMTVMSAYSMSADMYDAIAPICGSSLGTDIMGWTKAPADCFRREFNQKLPQWISEFPRLAKYWSTLSADDQAQALIWLEHGARRDGYTNEPFDQFDYNAMATILHYTESLFDRFDIDENEIVSKSEIKNAYPIFKLLLAKKANMPASNDFILKGIFTYIVRYRAMPETNGIGDIVHFGWWLAIYSLPTTHYSADRLGVFNIVCQLALPESASQQAMTPTICQP